MCFKKKKKQEPINSKFHLEQRVQYRDRYGDFIIGYVYKIRKENGKILYDVQVGGECPFIKKDIPEEELI